MKFGILALMQSPTGKPFKQVYDESIAEFVLADELGFDCIWLTEHHFSPDHHKELGRRVRDLLLAAGPGGLRGGR